eukprot:TRINITY_DN3043_c0_g1_i2.p2 TRINITY_DN3043_c0_g1~~TRINITY_DN3043_c0_g1_i2.p2  ORF type:complete len:101 (-),score=10.50 TRINITY_DN3043_c0_g1_i2:69-371(-)
MCIRDRRRVHGDEKNGHKPLEYLAHPCNKKVNGTLDGYKNVTTCPCKFCDYSCNGTLADSYPGSPYFSGFSITLVLIVYVMIFILSALAEMWKNYSKRVS